MIKAALFDMDGLVLDTERLALQAFRETVDELGLTFRLESFQQLLGLNPIDGRRVFQQVMPEVKIDEFGPSWDRKYEALMRSDIPLRPFVKEVLVKIEVPMVVVTSTRTQSAKTKLQRAGLFQHFACIIGGDAVTNGKPHPEPYLMGARSLGVDPRQCAAFEDSENGTRAAIAAGCVTVQVPDLVHPSDAIRAWGHTIAPDLYQGAQSVGLID